MKTRDYLHSELLGVPSNDKVFQKTYNLIGELAKELSESQAKGFDIKINEFGEMDRNLPVDALNSFLNENVADKKLNQLSEEE